MIIDIRNEAERQEMLRALRLLDKYPLPDVPDLNHIKEELEKGF